MSTLNDTLEEELRRLLVEKNNECQSLKNHIKLLEKNIKDEQDMKYRAYVKLVYPIGSANKILVEKVNKEEQLKLRLESSEAFKELEEQIKNAQDD